MYRVKFFVSENGKPLIEQLHNLEAQINGWLDSFEKKIVLDAVSIETGLGNVIILARYKVLGQE